MQLAPPEPSDFMKLIESLIGREVAPLPPTQFQGQDDSVFPSGKGQEASAGDTNNATRGSKNLKDQKDPGNPRDPNDQQPNGLVAMMTAIPPTARTKPSLSLNLGRSSAEDSFVKSSRPEAEEEISYSREISVAVSPQAQTQTQPLFAIAFPTSA